MGFLRQQLCNKTRANVNVIFRNIAFISMPITDPDIAEKLCIY